MIDKLAHRRTQYSLGRNVSISENEIDRLVRDAIRHAPSAFNSQSSRAVILFGDPHVRLWDIVKTKIAALIQGDALEKSLQKIDTFAAGIGSVMFFEVETVVLGMQERFPLYAHHFPLWSEQSTGMAQLGVWTTLADVGIGASLQHYNPLIDDAVRSDWSLPETWRLRAQMPFGSNEAPFPEKTFMAEDKRFRTFR
jgi:predicted oxidoreductase (fatty acid repression mutant protein)